VRTVAPDDGDIGIARVVVAPEHIEHARTREQEPDIIGRPFEPFFDIEKILRIAKCGEHEE
jgi:hypothetical protein